jgi:hypothetical protein
METNKIKNWNSFNVKESDGDLLSDLESLGVSEKSWTLEQIQDAFRSSMDVDLFIDGTYAEPSFSDDFEWNMDENGDSAEVEARFTGAIHFEMDNREIATAVIRLLEREPRISTDEPKWEAQEIRDAIDDIEFTDRIDPDYSTIDVEFSTNVYNEGVNLEASVDEESLGIEFDEDSAWEDMEYALQSMK